MLYSLSMGGAMCFSWLYTHQPNKFVVYMHALVFLTVYNFLFWYYNFLYKFVKDFWVEFLVRKKNHAVGVYIINFSKLHITKTEFCISSLRKYYTDCVWWYTPLAMIYRLRLMIYAFGDDIHTKVWWYTIAFAMDKKRQSSDCLFWSWKRDSNTRPMVVFKDK